MADPGEKDFYGGFWIRLLATIFDLLLILAITWPILLTVHGARYLESDALVYSPLDFLLSYVFPFIATVAFWMARSATPGKMVLKLRIVDATTGRAPTPGQCVGRYLAYFLSLLPIALGYVWVAVDVRKQGWHDKLANTVVLRRRSAADQPATFPPSA
jgi:uncharacterized RDD family membrane protein YckC